MKKKIGFFIMIGSISVFMAGCKDTQDVIEQENPEIAETENKVAEEEKENEERDCGEESDEIENWSWMEENEDDSRFQVEGQEPFYEYYYDEDGELFLTLYYDEETKQGKGISYGYGSENNKIGFTFDKYEEQIWTKTELLTYDGVPLEKSWLILKDIETFQEYDENGRMSHYKYVGYADSSNTLDDEKMEVVCEIAYIYIGTMEHFGKSMVICQEYIIMIIKTVILTSWDEKLFLMNILRMDRCRNIISMMVRRKSLNTVLYLIPDGMLI